MRAGSPDLPRVVIVSMAFFLAGSAAAQEFARFQRGDANADARLDLSDAVFAFEFLFLGSVQAACSDAVDANDDGGLDLTDPVHLLRFLFLRGPRPATPSYQCGVDPTEDRLTCEAHPPCSRPGGFPNPRLTPAGDCGSVLSSLRRKIAESMEAALERNQQFTLEVARAGDCWCLLHDCGCAYCGMDPDTGVSPPDLGNPGAPDRPEEYTGTNLQVEGVDEADFLKTDGAYIYLVAGGRFQVIDSWPASAARRIAAVEVAGTPRKLLVHGDRAVVYSSLEPLTPPADDPVLSWRLGPGLSFSPGECTYGYDCEFAGDGRRLKVTVLDIADRAQPRLLRELEFDGSYLGARRIGDLAHTVVILPEATVPGVAYWPEELENSWEFCERRVFPYTDTDVRRMFAELKERNVALIEGASDTDLLPSFRDTRYGDGVPRVSGGLLQKCQGMYVSPSGDGASLLSLVSFRIHGSQDIEATTILGKPGAVYASRDSLYIAARHQSRVVDPWYFESRDQVPEATTIHKFQLFYDRPGSHYLGSGVVKGRILNQFSLDEFQGHLRVATTTGHLPSPNVHSTVSVLGAGPEGLVLVGQVDGIAPTEDIRSVRFGGNLGYLVTFKKTDPLFVLDLSEPRNPAIRGELKIPGFSTYLHLLDDRHVLSIGFDADDQGSFAWFQGILLQVFDVADPENPLLLHKEVIGARGSTSDAATDHLAFNYFGSRGLLALPMVVCEGGGAGGFGDRLTFSGLMVYRVDLAKGFEYLGGVPHPAAAAEGGDRFWCMSWWTQPSTQVKRSIFMDDHVYAVALDRIDVSRLDDLEHPVAGISLEE